MESQERVPRQKFKFLSHCVHLITFLVRLQRNQSVPCYGAVHLNDRVVASGEVEDVNHLLPPTHLLNPKRVSFQILGI